MEFQAEIKNNSFSFLNRKFDCTVQYFLNGNCDLEKLIDISEAWQFLSDVPSAMHQGRVKGRLKEVPIEAYCMCKT